LIYVPENGTPEPSPCFVFLGYITEDLLIIM
jgi:hypothetical protein